MLIMGEKNVLAPTVYDKLVSGDLSRIVSLAILQAESGGEGLSNISQGLKGRNRSIVNSSALGVLVGAGMNAAILNPLDRLVIETAKTVKFLCADGIYCDAYLCG